MQERKALLAKLRVLIQSEQRSSSASQQQNQDDSTLLHDSNVQKLALQGLEAKMKEMQISLASMVKREEVSHAIRNNSSLESAEAERAQIEANPMLNNYYQCFSSIFNQNFVGSMGQASGRIALNPTVLNIPIDDIGNLFPLPLVSDIVRAICTIANTGLKIVERNMVKRLSELAPGVASMEAMIEETARKLTLLKKDEILQVKDSTHHLVAIFSKLKDRVCYNAYDTPEKKLALTDASKLLMACMAGKVNPEQPVVAQFLEIMQADAVARSFEDKVIKAADRINTAGQGIAGVAAMPIDGVVNPILSAAGTGLVAAQVSAAAFYDASLTAASQVKESNLKCCVII
jgi:hypothetical protein